jgi:O-antigen/teichoic acid export membrane protein
MPPAKPSSFGSDVFKLVGGTTIAQAITVLASPVITRLYGPEAYGLFALISSITSILGIVACLRYELAILLPKEDREASNVFGLCLLCATVVTGLTVCGLYFGGGILVSYLNAPDLVPYLVLVPPMVLVHGVYISLNYWNSRTKKFGRLSISRVIGALASTGTQLGAGFAGYATGGSLIGANLAGTAVTAGVLGSQILREDYAVLRGNISWKGMIGGLKRYKKFPLIDTWSTLLNNISWQLPAFLLAAFFSTSVVGYYALGWRMIQFPMSLIGTAISQVFFQRASVAIHQGSLASVTESIFEVLLLLGLFPMLLIAVAGENLFFVIFGAAWSTAGLYSQILSIWAIVWFLSSPLSSIYAVSERIGLGLGLSALNITTRFLSLYVGGVMGSELLAIALFSASGFVTYGIICGIALRVAGASPRKIAGTILTHARTAAVFLIPVVVVQIFLPNPYVVVGAAAICLVGYYLAIYLRDPRLRSLAGSITGRS